MGDRIKRIIAAIIDWNICCLPGMAVALFAFSKMMQGGNANIGFFILYFLAVLSMWPLFILRDVIFGGRSLGKRILSLYILDAATGQKASIKQVILKNVPNIISALMVVDIFLILFSDKTLGERLGKTVVVGRYTAECMKNGEEIGSPTTRQRVAALAAICGIVLVLFILAGKIFIEVSSHRREQHLEYQVAETYLVESDYFKDYGLQAEDVSMRRSYNEKRHGEASVVCEFHVEGYPVDSIPVVLHMDRYGQWVPCRFCTMFE